MKEILAAIVAVGFLAAVPMVITGVLAPQVLLIFVGTGFILMKS